MTIPEAQLQTWANPGATSTAQATHQSIRSALSTYKWPTAVAYDVYLQGSYRNTTNIRGDSDVDVVVQLDTAFRSDKSLLSPEGLAQFQRDYHNATYGQDEFRTDVIAALRSYYGYSKIAEGRKSLKVQTPYLPADVVVCIQYRRYRRHLAGYVVGMTFYVPTETRWVVNYPKVHYENGTRKQSETHDWFKATVRLFKNARTHLVERYIISSDLAPSYFIECLLWNVPSSQFGGNYQDTFVNVVNWLNQANLDKFVCQSEEAYLFGTTPEQWTEHQARSFTGSVITLWNNWTR